MYKNKFKELIDSQSERILQDIEFGIDNDNPFYSNDENNEIIKSRRINNIQFNQFTYILLKNFESKNILKIIKLILLMNLLIIQLIILQKKFLNY